VLLHSLTCVCLFQSIRDGVRFVLLILRNEYLIHHENKATDESKGPTAKDKTKKKMAHYSCSSERCSLNLRK